MIEVLRLGHRPFRDKRLSTHVALTSRAFGASKLWYTGHKDLSFETSVAGVVKNFGGSFSVGYIENAITFAKNRKGEGWLVVHLSMYGLKLQEEISKIRKAEKSVLVIVGGEKVDWDFYKLSDYNLSVTTQPHSEVSSLALFLDRYFAGAELDLDFGGKTKIIPEALGKNVLKT